MAANILTIYQRLIITMPLKCNSPAGLDTQPMLFKLTLCATPDPRATGITNSSFLILIFYFFSFFSNI